MKLEDIAEETPDVLNGKLVFKGTRVSVLLIVEYLLKGWHIKDIRSSYPTVPPSSIKGILKILQKAK